MKNKGFRLGLLVMILAFGMTVVGCDNSGGGDEGGGGFIGETLTLSGQVWVYISGEGEVKYTENGTVTSEVGGSGTITEGQLEFSIDTPSEFNAQGFIASLVEGFHNFNINPSNANAAVIYYLKVTGSNKPMSPWSNNIRKYWMKNNWIEDIYYIYVDRDVVITGGAKTTEYECECGDCDCEDLDDECYCDWTSISKDLNLNLIKGWNVIRIKNEETGHTETTSITIGDSSGAYWGPR